MEIERCYEILELPYGASLAEVHEQWKTLSKIFLNDRAGFAPGTKEYEFALRKMQDINQAHASLKKWLEESPVPGSAAARRGNGGERRPETAERKQPHKRPGRDSNLHTRSAVPLVYPTFQPTLLETLIDKMETGNQFMRAALLLLAVMILFGPLVLFPLLAGAIGEAALRWLYRPAGVLLMLTAMSLWVFIICGNFIAIRDELQVHRNRAPGGFHMASSAEAWCRVETAISEIRYNGRSWSAPLPSRDSADASAKCVYDFDLPYHFLWWRFASHIKLTVKIKPFPAQNLALACYWLEKDRSHWWRLPAATLMKKTSAAVAATFND